MARIPPFKEAVALAQAVEEVTRGEFLEAPERIEGQMTADRPLRWYPFSESKGYRQKRPPIKKEVLVLAWNEAARSSAMVVGYRKDAAGDKSCPYFVCPGTRTGFVVVAWCDCLPDELRDIYNLHKRLAEDDRLGDGIHMCVRC